MSDITALVPAGVLTDKQLRFAQEYLLDCNATAAATRAGYSEHSAKFSGRDCLQNPTISRLIEEERKKLSDKTHISQGDVLFHLREVAARCMVGEKVMEFDPVEKMMVHNGEWQFDSKGAVAAWALIAKMLGFIDKKEDAKGGGFTLNIITQAAQLEMTQANGITLENDSARQGIVQDGLT